MRFMNPAARYIRQSNAYVAAPVSGVVVRSCGENDSIATTVWGVTTHTNVFALHVSLRVLGGAQGDVCLTPVIADGISMSIDYSNGAWAVGGLGRRSVGKGVAVAKMESCVTNRRIEAHMAVSPLPSLGEVHIGLAMEDGSKLGEWLLYGESILKSSKTVTRHDSA